MVEWGRVEVWRRPVLLLGLDNGLRALVGKKIGC